MGANILKVIGYIVQAISDRNNFLILIEITLHGNGHRSSCTHRTDFDKYSNNAKLPCVSFIYKCEKRQIDVKTSKLTSEVEN